MRRACWRVFKQDQEDFVRGANTDKATASFGGIAVAALDFRTRQEPGKYKNNGYLEGKAKECFGSFYETKGGSNIDIGLNHSSSLILALAWPAVLEVVCDKALRYHDCAASNTLPCWM